MIGKITEIAEKTAKHVQDRVYNNSVQQVFSFSKRELANFVNEIVHECAKICVEDIEDPRGSPEEKCASKIIEYFGA